jgi:pimeloyl-ACP methyl ester carboxylesterase
VNGVRAGGRLHVRDFPGAEPALVVLHGFPDDSRIYDRVAPQLAPRRVVAVDWLGYGRSDRFEPGLPTSTPASYASLPKIAIAPNPAADRRHSSGPMGSMLATKTVHVHLTFMYRIV